MQSANPALNPFSAPKAQNTGLSNGPSQPNITNNFHSYNNNQNAFVAAPNISKIHSSTPNGFRILNAFANQYMNLPFFENIIITMMYNIDSSNSIGGKNNQALQSIKTFLSDCNKDLDLIKNSVSTLPIDLLRNAIRFTRQVLELRSSVGNRLITYDNLEDHFANIKDIQIKKMILNIKQNRLKTADEFRKNHDIILQTVTLSSQLRSIRESMLAVDKLMAESESGSMPLLTMAEEWKNAISGAYSDISNLKVLHKVSELSDYMIIGGDEKADNIANSITTYLSEGYSFFKSGFSLIDNSIGGIESANVHIICGPSNSAKSIFMINLSWKMMLENMQLFNDGDMFVFYTLEDDIYKLIRRFISIIGNVDTLAIRELFIRSSTLLKKHNDKDIKNTQVFKDISKIFQNLLEESLFKSTGKRLRFLLKHSHGEPVSPGDMIKFIDARRCEGLRVRALFIDYIDVMAPTHGGKVGGYDDYNSQGIITQELRNLAAEYSIPVITITQATRSTENSPTVSNENMADSHKKVRYSDYIYMVRIRNDLNILAECVKKDILPLEDQADLNFSDLNNVNNQKLQPFEMKITKAKDGAKNELKYLIFSGNNLRIYEQLNDVYTTISDLHRRSSMLNNQIELLGVNDVRTIQATSSMNLLE